MFDFMPPNKIINEGSDHLQYSLSFPEDYVFYKGHFPDFSLLPGMIQVHLAIQFSKEKFKLNGKFEGFKSVKFSKPLTPCQDVTLELKYLPDKKILNFVFKKNELDFYSKGSIIIS